jgi:GT2 family glycosyltransferase
MEDFELAVRLRVAGWTAAIAPDAIAIHVGSATFGRLSERQRWLGGFGRGYVVRRYQLLRQRYAIQIIATELAIALVDSVLHHDLAALKGRVTGWRTARGLEPRVNPPASAIEHSIGFVNSLRRRRASLDPADS